MRRCGIERGVHCDREQGSQKNNASSVLYTQKAIFEIIVEKEIIYEIVLDNGF